MSLERLVPTKDHMKRKADLSVEQDRLREEKEYEKCTFQPQFEKRYIDRDLKMESVPGAERYFQRMKEHYQEDRRKKSYFDNLGSKYKGESTTPEPFSFVREVPRIKKDEQISPVIKSSKPTAKRTPVARPVSEASKSPVKESTSTPKIVDQSFKKSENSKTEENFAKLRIHYSKEKYAEIKVYENTNPEELAQKF